MQIDYRSYPHPVLSYFSDDLIGCAFQTNLQTAVSKTAYKFNLVSKTSCKSLLGLVGNRKAQHAAHFECASTRYRRLFTSFDEFYQIEVPSEFLDGRVQLCTFILAAEDVPAYTNDNFHADYGGRSFFVRKGDVLAVDRDRYFIAEKEIDPLKNIPSIFTIVKDNAENAEPFDLDITGQKVVIKLSAENFDSYRALSLDQGMRTTLCSLVIAPALISLLEMIDPGTESAQQIDYEERRWFRVLTRRLRELGYDWRATTGFPDSALVIAQKLVGQPVSSSLKALLAYGENEEGMEITS